MNRARAAELIARFPKQRILVIGDVFLDEFIWGKVSRISPEAPVPVVVVASESYYPGGAANVARNLAEFTPGVRMMGMVGLCSHARQLRQLLMDRGVKLDSMIEISEFQTIVKTRIIARNQQVVRVDREKKRTLTDGEADRALAQIEDLLPELDALIIEDYGKGLLTQYFASKVCELAHRAGKIVAIDPNPTNPVVWKHATVIKPNRSEAFASAGIPSSEPVEPPEQDPALLEVGRILSQKWDTQQLLITLGEQGVLLFHDGAVPYHTPTRAREIFDVSGAGDTVISLYTLSLCAGAAPDEAAELANHASGIVVGKLGTATVSPEELLASFVE
jgi:D-beta-D-heptose 7-phosphate kinase/D-beta-D-heptose 1-phosphate adenosyltransferase